MTLLYKDIVQDIKDKIEMGILKEGKKIPSERELSQTYDVSRNVIREAISVLRVKGLLKVYAGKGAYVSKPEPIIITETIERIMQNYNTTIEDVLEVREELEKAIIKKAVTAATSDDIQKLKGIYQKMESSKADLEKFTQLDVMFHVALAQSTKNPLFHILLNSFMEMTQHVLFVFTKLIPDTVVKVQSQHLALIQAIENGDKQLAESVICKVLVTK